MSESFGPAYAAVYDWLYAAKDYPGEAALIHRVFEQYGSFPVRRILDLGCGSGSHAIELAKLGYEVTGVDRSPAMLAEAARRVQGQKVRLVHGELQDLHLEDRFDAVLMMFAVLGYQLTDAHVDRAFNAAHRHLRPGGLLLFDFWYGPAVLAQKPSERSLTVNTSGGSITRRSIGTLDEVHHVCHVDFEIDPNIAERHTVRYYFADEIGDFLNAAGFELLRLGAFPDFDREPGADTWNVMALARS